MYKKQVLLNLNQDLYEEILASKEADVPVSKFLRQIIIEYLESKKAK